MRKLSGLLTRLQLHITWRYVNETDRNVCRFVTKILRRMFLWVFIIIRAARCIDDLSDWLAFTTNDSSLVSSVLWTVSIVCIVQVSYIVVRSVETSFCIPTVCEHICASGAGIANSSRKLLTSSHVASQVRAPLPVTQASQRRLTRCDHISWSSERRTTKKTASWWRQKDDRLRRMFCYELALSTVPARSTPAENWTGLSASVLREHRAAVRSSASTRRRWVR